MGFRVSAEGPVVGVSTKYLEEPKSPYEEVRNSLYRGYVSSRFGIDFELDDFSLTAEAALTQSREKRYADAYLSDGRRVVYVGVNYDPAARTIGEVKTATAVG